MCGLAGFLKSSELSADEIGRDLPRMADALRHRGPDDEGLWHDARAGIALCHRRLSIIDLSPLGHQPMRSASQRYVIVYNGEIYNYLDLRKDLVDLGYTFRGGSDTEVFLAAVECWGVAAAIERCAGMFAFALWDRQTRVLHLARDRFGEKPLYFGICGDTLLFGSELKALRQHRSWLDEIDRDALALMMQHDSIPAPFSVFKNIGKVMPGSLVSVHLVAKQFVIEEHRYWRPHEYLDRAAQENPQFNASESLELLEQALFRAIGRQMIADVPVGAFLSGGTDSSLIVALMQKASSQRVRTFSVGFPESAYDEAPFARSVARHLQTDHTEFTVSPRDCLNVIPLLPQIYDEPFADSSQIPTYLVCKMARRAVTVALSGDAGDELFAGYRRYQTAMGRWQFLKRFPAALRAGGSALVDRLPRSALEIAARPAAFIWGRYGAEGLADRMQDHTSQWKATTLRDFYRVGMHRWPASSGFVAGVGPAAIERIDHTRPQYADGLKQMMHLDTCGYLPNDILVKVDRAAMAVSLETRVPFLDVDVALAAWRIPSSVLLKDGRGKWVLRELLKRHVPASLVDRPKKGFAVPLAQWLRTDLRPWAGDLLDPSRLRTDGFLDAAMVQRRWRQHLSGKADWSQHLWNVLTFQSWLEHWRVSRAEPVLQAKAS
jgi:asparagine synthase (glutamine-hydrolysing)